MKRQYYCCLRLNQKGFSLIELLVAAAVGLILMGAIYQVFLTSDTAYRYNEQNSRLQENSRYIGEYIAREARMAGFYGCAGVESYDDTLNGDDFVYDFGEAIYGLEANGGTYDWIDSTGDIDPTDSTSSGLGLGSPVTGSDILVLRGVDPDVEIEVIGDMPSTSADFKVTAGLSGILNTGGGDILMITNCVQAMAFQTASYNDSGNLVHNTASSATPGNWTKDLGDAFEDGADVYIPRTVIIYVQNNTDGDPSLYVKSGTSPTAEVISGVETMQVLYGLDSDDDQNVESFVTADSVTDWQDVLAIRVGLLLRSPKEIAKKGFDTSTYDVNGTTIDPIGNGTPSAPVDDRRLRLVLVTTMGLRNRLP
jgi:type IV pilus assembly protein PilW